MAARQANEEEELREVMQSYIDEVNELVIDDVHEAQNVMNQFFLLNYNRLPTIEEARVWVNNRWDRIHLLRNMIREIQRILNPPRARRRLEF